MMFGLWGACPENVPTAWGARAIVERWNGKVSVGLVWDRQSWRGEEDERRRFSELINDGPLKAALKSAEERFASYEMSTSGEGVVTLYDKDGIIIKGDPRASYGYLYLIAYERPEAS